jgi:leader peptidase (prepilin peptidase) / N-methyltransferase
MIVLLAFVVGAAIGSFLNVVILRVPAGRSIVRPGSQCACGAPIPWRDKIPILSWLLLGGRARCCGRPFSARYPAVELLTALLFAASALRLPPPAAACVCLLIAALVAAAFIDIDTLQIPDVLTVGLAAAGVALSVALPSLHGEAMGPPLLDALRSAADSVAGLLAGSGLLLWIGLAGTALLRRDALGFGDVKLAGAIGAFCGWHGAVFSIFGGAIAGCAFLLPATLLSRSKPAFGRQVPFGPMLAVGAAAYLLALRGPVDAWFANVEGLFR